MHSCTPHASPRSVKALGEADSDDDSSALSWVDKMRQKEEEKKLAQERVSWESSVAGGGAGHCLRKEHSLVCTYVSSCYTSNGCVLVCRAVSETLFIS